MPESITFLVQSLLRKNKISIDDNELELQIESHPSYPSLHAITGVLNHFNIENTAVKVPVNKETLEQMPSIFIAQIKRNNGNDLVLVLKKGTEYKLIFDNKVNETISELNFSQQFTGVLVAVEKSESDSSNQAKTFSYQKPLIAFAFMLFCLLFFISNQDLSASIYFILSLAGVSISYLIIQHGLGLDSKIISTICSQDSKTTNCNAVLNSKGATLYKSIKMSDVSLIYFVSVSLASLLLSLVETSLTALYIISVAALPIVVYSIYYQIKVSKNWCVLCLGVASVLVLQSLIFFFTNFNFSLLNIKSTLLIGFSFAIISSVWLFINTLLKQQQAFKKLKIESIKFKRNFDLFNTLLQQSETIDTLLPNTREIVFGNKNALLNITIITNPFCGHCKDVHDLVELLINKHHAKLNITVRFNINTENLESDGVLVSSRLLELFHMEGEVSCLKAMHDIYNDSDSKKWFIKWGAGSASKSTLNTLETESNWCIKNNINFTPEILINGKAYPKAYNRTDLEFFIEELQEACHTNLIINNFQETI
ncbi:hypothetical protein BZARG_916 [Bizionia argentinensis JUB59]|uniref:Vitamin K epoxide reductase domain-containing protein n=1 Tax=Bizionia argentinensis JUB59 TaxID=1046627 RepID=G2EBN7_9FLAO|nr:vitamin K epoxide reductase family protein [Bizionia argentinensis]EGV44165.1 hypothetical protein BZARG_916 [Bizionia argentinensis JUB59]